MKFKAKKVYGQSKVSRCPFCDKLATRKSEQGLDVCPQHVKGVLEEIKCVCGSWLEVRDGKFGPYFNCMNCGNMNYAKGMEMKALMVKDKPKEVTVDKPKSNYLSYNSYEKKERKEITISSNDVEYFD
jgi:hypothetical protein